MSPQADRDRHDSDQSSRPSLVSGGRAQVRFKNSYVDTIIVPHSMALSDLGAMPRQRPIHPSSAMSFPAAAHVDEQVRSD